MQRLTILFVLIICSGCTSVNFVRKDFTPQKQAVLKYQATSDSNKDQKYKNKVDKEARQFCGGDFAITKEYQAREYTDTSSGVGTGFGVGFGGVMLGASQSDTAMYTFVEVACKAEGGREPASAIVN